MTARMVRMIPMYMAEWENGTRAFFPTRDVHMYIPSRVSADRSRAYAEEMIAAADLLDEWAAQAQREDAVMRRKHSKHTMKYVPRLFKQTKKDDPDGVL